MVNVDFLPVECQCHHFSQPAAVAASRLLTNTEEKKARGWKDEFVGEEGVAEKSELGRQNLVAGS